MRALAATLVLYGSALAVVLVVLAALGRDRGPRTAAGLVLVQVATTLWVLVEAVRTLVSGHGGSDLVIHLAYLATAVAVLPVSHSVAGSDRRRWGNVAMAVACLLLVVVLVRAQQTGVLAGAPRG